MLNLNKRSLNFISASLTISTVTIGLLHIYRTYLEQVPQMYGQESPLPLTDPRNAEAQRMRLIRSAVREIWLVPTKI